MQPSTVSRTILCVDDEAGALLVRKAVLKSAGYKVITALNAGDALAILRSSDIHLVITDHLLPGVTGIEMARQMKSAKPDLPILLLSGVVDPPDGIECVDKFLGKTEGAEKLLETIAGLLRYRRFRVDGGLYWAQIACDTLGSPTVWHYMIYRVGSSEFISCNQSSTQEAAVAGAKDEMVTLNESLGF